MAFSRLIIVILLCFFNSFNIANAISERENYQKISAFFYDVSESRARQSNLQQNRRHQSDADQPHYIDPYLIISDYFMKSESDDDLGRLVRTTITIHHDLKTNANRRAVDVITSLKFGSTSVAPTLAFLQTMREYADFSNEVIKMTMINLQELNRIRAYLINAFAATIQDPPKNQLEAPVDLKFIALLASTKIGVQEGYYGPALSALMRLREERPELMRNNRGIRIAVKRWRRFFGNLPQFDAKTGRFRRFGLACRRILISD